MHAHELIEMQRKAADVLKIEAQRLLEREGIIKKLNITIANHNDRIREIEKVINQLKRYSHSPDSL